MPYADPEAAPAAAPAEEAPEGDAGGGDVFASVNSTLDDIFKELGVEE
jgi:hypothetical protein